MLKKIAICFNIVACFDFYSLLKIFQQKKILKQHFLVSGNVDDEGWNQSAYEGLVLIQEKHGWDIAYTETVGQAEQYDIMRRGFDLIIGHGFQYEDALSRAAEQHPDVYFLQIWWSG